MKFIFPTLMLSFFVACGIMILVGFPCLMGLVASYLFGSAVGFISFMFFAIFEAVFVAQFIDI